jgi:hypothetical protein
LEIGQKLKALDLGASTHELVDCPSEIEDCDELRVWCSGRFGQLRPFLGQGVHESLELRRKSCALSPRTGGADAPERRTAIPRRDVLRAWLPERQERPTFAQRCACIRH